MNYSKWSMYRDGFENWFNQTYSSFFGRNPRRNFCSLEIIIAWMTRTEKGKQLVKELNEEIENEKSIN